MTKNQENTKIETDINNATVKIPNKFLDSEGQLKTDDLLKSYLELERKLSSVTPLDEESSKTPKKYQLTMKSPLVQEDPEINQILLEHGFTNDQAQLVYDLASDKIIPALQKLMDDISTDQELQGLEQAFGGPEQFNIVARQISAWGEKNLDQKTFMALASTKDGILTMYKMMQGDLETPLLKGQGHISPQDDEASLKKLMQSPKYWRDQDPELLKRVEAGFKRLYD